MRYRFVITFIFIVLPVLSGTLVFSDEALSASKQALAAAKVKTAPAGPDDSAWGKAKAIQVPFEGKENFSGKKTSVITKAVYTNNDIYFLEINRINNFATKGCAVVCHVPAGATNAKEGKFGTATAAEKGDLWHWKAARSDPAGFADDTYLTKIGDKKGGRKSDAGKGGDKKNMTADKSKPMYMPASGNLLGKHGILLAAQSAEISDYSVFKTGDTLTYRLPKMPKGSRGDIKAVSSYGNGGWSVMLYRKLDTGHDDDVAFNPRKKYNFAMALFDDSGDEDSYDSEVITLQFKR
ncbi:MAG: hypothetical protein JRG81_11575 [Deltaproteobacteria bacterium]|nr:hypothetical protein [Deltaproteobacteria bacterium]